MRRLTSSPSHRNASPPRVCTTTSFKADPPAWPADPSGFHIPGEIDLIIIDVRRRRIWVVEAKDCQVSVDPDRLLHDVTDFHGIPDDVGHRHRGYARHPEKAFVGKLLAKTAAVESQVTA